MKNKKRRNYIKILVIGGNNCTYCKIAKSLLDDAGLEYTYENVHEDPAVRTKLGDLNLRSIPQIFVNDEHIGGSVELNTFLKEIGSNST